MYLRDFPAWTRPIFVLVYPILLFVLAVPCGLVTGLWKAGMFVWETWSAIPTCAVDILTGRGYWKIPFTGARDDF